MKALRFYEKIGLARPYAINPETGYRYYSIEQFMLLDIIMAARTMGLSPAAIRTVLEKEDNDRALAILRTQKDAAEKKIRELRRAIATIEAADAAIGRSASSASEEGLYVREIPERRIVAKEIGDNYDEIGQLIGFSSLDRAIAARKLINAFESGILLAPDAGSTFRPTHIFTTVVLDSDSDTRNLGTIPPGSFLCVSYVGGKAQAQQAKMNEYLRRKRIRPERVILAELVEELRGAAPANSGSRLSLGQKYWMLDISS